MPDFYKIGVETAKEEHHKIRYNIKEQDLYKLAIRLRGVRMFGDDEGFFWKGVCAYLTYVDEIIKE